MKTQTKDRQTQYQKHRADQLHKSLDKNSGATSIAKNFACEFYLLNVFVDLKKNHARTQLKQEFEEERESKKEYLRK